MSDKQGEIKYTYIDYEDICVACGRPAAPGSHICNVCMGLARQYEEDVQKEEDRKQRRMVRFQSEQKRRERGIKGLIMRFVRMVEGF